MISFVIIKDITTIYTSLSCSILLIYLLAFHSVLNTTKLSTFLVKIKDAVINPSPEPRIEALPNLVLSTSLTPPKHTIMTSIQVKDLEVLGIDKHGNKFQCSSKIENMLRKSSNLNVFETFHKPKLI